MKPLQNILSIKNNRDTFHKIITILGIKIKLKTKKLKKRRAEVKSVQKEPYWITILRNNNYEINEKDRKYKTPCGLEFDNINYGLLEVFHNKDYEIYFNREAILIDLGLNIGMTTLYFAKNKNIKKIYSFEPFTPTYDLAIKNIEKNPILKAKIETFNYGLDKEEKEIEMPYSSEISGCMSTTFNPFKINTEICKTVEKIEKIQTKKASEILKPIINKHVKKNELIILKIDTEGAEFAIFEDLEKEKLFNHVDIIMLEYHFKSPKELENILLKNNFIIRYEPATIQNVGMMFGYKIKQ